MGLSALRRDASDAGGGWMVAAALSIGALIVSAGNLVDAANDGRSGQLDAVDVGVSEPEACLVELGDVDPLAADQRSSEDRVLWSAGLPERVSESRPLELAVVDGFVAAIIGVDTLWLLDPDTGEAVFTGSGDWVRTTHDRVIVRDGESVAAFTVEGRQTGCVADAVFGARGDVLLSGPDDPGGPRFTHRADPSTLEVVHGSLPRISIHEVLPLTDGSMVVTVWGDTRRYGFDGSVLAARAGHRRFFPAGPLMQMHSLGGDHVAFIDPFTFEAVWEADCGARPAVCGTFPDGVADDAWWFGNGIGDSMYAHEIVDITDGRLLAGPVEGPQPLSRVLPADDGTHLLKVRDGTIVFDGTGLTVTSDPFPDATSQGPTVSIDGVTVSTTDAGGLVAMRTGEADTVPSPFWSEDEDR